LLKAIAGRPKNEADDKRNEEPVRVVLVSPPVKAELPQDGCVSKHQGSRDGENSPEILRGDDTHWVDSLDVFVQKGQVPERKPGAAFFLKRLRE